MGVVESESEAHLVAWEKKECRAVSTIISFFSVCYNRSFFVCFLHIMISRDAFFNFGIIISVCFK